MRKRILVILFPLLSGLVGLAQSTSFSATVDKQQILIGEPFQLTVETPDAEARLALPALFEHRPGEELAGRRAAA